MHGRKKERLNESDAERTEKHKKIAKYVKMSTTVLTLHQNKVYTDEGYQLTDIILEKNPDYYTAFNYRKLLVQHYLEKASSEEKLQLLLKELDLTAKALAHNPKSYCAWHHRLWVIGYGRSSLQKELQLCSLFFQKDARNFHCWRYRGYVAQRLPGGPDLRAELDFTREKINENFSNYSAWHYRSVLIAQLHLLSSDDELFTFLDQEFELLKQAFYTEPYDQSAWLYHRWLVSICLDRQTLGTYAVSLSAPHDLNQAANTSSLNPRSFAILSRELKMCEQLLELEPDCKWALLTAASLMNHLRFASTTSETDAGIFKSRILHIMETLSSLDPMRAGYYEHMRGKFLSETFR